MNIPFFPPSNGEVAWGTAGVGVGLITSLINHSSYLPSDPTNLMAGVLLISLGVLHAKKSPDRHALLGDQPE